VDAQNSGTNRYSFYGVSDTLYQGGVVSIGGALRHTGAQLGLYGVSSIVRSAAFTPTNVTTDRSYDANSTTVDEIADVLGTLITDLQATGIIA
jgi:hypothetical protein